MNSTEGPTNMNGEGHQETKEESKQEEIRKEEEEQIDSSDEYDPANVQDFSTVVETAPLLSEPSSTTTPISPSNATAPPPQTTTGPSEDGVQTSTETNSTNMPQANGAVSEVATQPSENPSESRPNSVLNTGTQPPPTPVTVANNAVKTSASASSSAPAVPVVKARLPHDKIGIIEDRIQDDPKGDISAWQSLIDEYVNRGKVEDVRKVYERFFQVFPCAVDKWLEFARFEGDAGNRAAVESIFQKTLTKIPSTELWQTYMNHIRRYFNITTDKTGKASQVQHQAYEAVLDAVGLDKDAGPIWQDYVNFIKAGPGVLGGKDWQDQSKMDMLRKAYQRACATPHQATETLWKDYNTFENTYNKQHSRKFISEHSVSFTTAKAAITVLGNKTVGLVRATLPSLPPSPGFAGDEEYQHQIALWQWWINWEKSDPMVFKDEDVEAYRKRIIYVYKHALMALRFWPDMWGEAVDWCFANGKETLGNEFLAEGISANPESCLLAFKRADRLESTTNNGPDDDSKIARGNTVREPYQTCLDALYALYAKTTEREARDVSRIEAEFATRFTQLDQQRESQKDDDDAMEAIDEQKKLVETQKAEFLRTAKTFNDAQLKLTTRLISQVWIALMRALQRMQGKGKTNAGAAIKGSRGIFAEARKRGRIRSDVYIAAALLEHNTDDQESAKRIFEKGLKLHPEDETFALEYIKLLVSSHDRTNARSVFEAFTTRLLSKPETTHKAKKLFSFFHDFESKYGELASTMKLEQRMREAFPDDPYLYAFNRRFIFNEFDPIVARVLISPMVQTRPKPSPMLAPSIETAQPGLRGADVLGQLNSPKRALPPDMLDGADGRPRKFTRAESPLKGAAGRRLGGGVNGQSSNLSAPAPPQPLPRDVLFLLSIIPNARTYNSQRFNPEALTNLLANTPLPPNANAMSMPGQHPQMHPSQLQYGMQPQHSMPQMMNPGYSSPHPGQAPVQHNLYPGMQPPSGMGYTAYQMR